MAKLPHTRAAMRAFYPVCQVAELAAGYGYTTARQQVFFIQPWLEPFDGFQSVIDLTDLGFILAGMAEENPCHNAPSLSGCIAVFYLPRV